MSHNRPRSRPIRVETDASPVDRYIESAEVLALRDIAESARNINGSLTAIVTLLTRLVPTGVNKATQVTISTELEPA